MIRRRFLLLFLLLVLTATCSYAQMFGQEPIERAKTYDVKHLAININVDLVKHSVDGFVMTQIAPLANDFSSFDVDGVGMKIKNVYVLERVSTKEDNKGIEVTDNYKPVKFDYDSKTIKVNLDKSYKAEELITYKIEYSTTEPEKGLYFIYPDSSQPQHRYEVWSQGEGEDNRYWFPCYDYPNNKATTEMIVTTDKQFETLSNGELVSAVENSDGTKTWHWVMDKPHSSYLVMLAIGNYDVIEDKYLDVPVYSYVPPGNKEMYSKSFERTADIVKFFSEYPNYKYPWGRFSQVVVQDFIYGGMENTSAVVLTESALYDDRTPPDYTATNLVAHELAHMWWGDAVTCRNWNETWLNESFATYFQCLYTKYAFGKDEFDYDIYRNGQSSINVDSIVSRKPIYTRNGHTTNTYDKGSVVLNMLHFLIGDSLFRKAMNIYITTNQFKNVTTGDLLKAVNKAVENPMYDKVPDDYKWFFDQWVYRAGQPTYEVSYDYNTDNQQMTLRFRQTQNIDSTTSMFRMPVPVEIETEKSKTSFTIVPESVAGTALVKLDSKPVCVWFNKGNKVLCKLYFKKPKEDWLHQLTKSTDAIDRIEALRGLADFINDEDVLKILAEFSKSDPFRGVRSEIAEVLAYSKSQTAIEIFKDKMKDDSDPRVRRDFISNLNKLVQNNPIAESNKQDLAEYLLGIINSETKCYYVISDGISILGQILPKEKIFDAISPYINMDSHADVIRRYALDALTKCDDPRTKDIFMHYAVHGITSRSRNNSIRGLQNFMSDEKVIDFLDDMLLKYNLRGTKYAILGVLEKAMNRNSLAYIQELMANSNDEGFRKRIRGILDKF